MKTRIYAAPAVKGLNLLLYKLYDVLVTFITLSTPRPTTLDFQPTTSRPLTHNPLDPQPFRNTPSTKVENGVI